jgi:8-oxo-dGTP diphosphatase
VPLIATCLCLLTRIGDEGQLEVLLGRKKTGLGTGKTVGLGGHVEDGETPGEAAAREVKEESGICVDPAGMVEVADITFRFPARPAWDMTVNVFTCGQWAGTALESAEIIPQWFPVADLPFASMWDDARHWLPRVLAGERIRASFSYADDCETVASADIRPA